MQKQYYLFEKGKVPALLIKFSGEKTSDLESNLENLALIGRMELKRAGKNPQDFYIKEFITSGSYVRKGVRRINFYDLADSISC